MTLDFCKFKRTVDLDRVRIKINSITDISNQNLKRLYRYFTLLNDGKRTLDSGMMARIKAEFERRENQTEQNKNETQICFIAHNGNTWYGWVYSLCREYWHSCDATYQIYIKPEYRNNGLAKKLMESAVNTIHEKWKHKGVAHYCYPENIPAKKLFSNLPQKFYSATDSSLVKPA